jgi:O-antigen ligase
MMVALVLNNRRIAFVSLVASLFVLYTMLHGRVKLWATRVGIFLLPLACLYLLAARTHTTGIFKPGAQLMSVSEQTDGSSRTRDIENYNLIQTIKPNPLIGTGWGHEYREMNRAYNISQIFAQYRFIAHNSILWLLSIGGVVGFALVWMQIVVGVFLSTRSYRFARDAHERTAAASMIAILICYVVQAWGDMGTQGGAPTLLLACALAGSGKLARATGAWPGRVRITADAPVAL